MFHVMSCNSVGGKSETDGESAATHLSARNWYAERGFGVEDSSTKVIIEAFDHRLLMKTNDRGRASYVHTSVAEVVGLDNWVNLSRLAPAMLYARGLHGLLTEAYTCYPKIHQARTEGDSGDFFNVQIIGIRSPGSRFSYQIDTLTKQVSSISHVRYRRQFHGDACMWYSNQS